MEESKNEELPHEKNDSFVSSSSNNSKNKLNSDLYALKIQKSNSLIL